MRTRPLRFTLALGAVLAASSLPLASSEQQVFAARDYFGVHRVVVSADGTMHLLYDGGIVHGAQLLSGPGRDQPLTYYTRSGPLGDVMRSSVAPSFQAVGVIGLGAGSMACYATPNQTWRFYPPRRLRCGRIRVRAQRTRRTGAKPLLTTSVRSGGMCCWWPCCWRWPKQL